MTLNHTAACARTLIHDLPQWHQLWSKPSPLFYVHIPTEVGAAVKSSKLASPINVFGRWQCEWNGQAPVNKLKGLAIVTSVYSAAIGVIASSQGRLKIRQETKIQQKQRDSFTLSLVDSELRTVDIRLIWSSAVKTNEIGGNMVCQTIRTGPRRSNVDDADSLQNIIKFIVAD
ncbi:hypothetical protein BJ165DRAFT_1399339 [Panaeolus papilionaceus]|nr:hypothetical protein BJ165DRAFT_1399339 [Panaeolus papilionaceus]